MDGAEQATSRLNGTGKPQRGRTRDPERCRRIMEAARSHFYTHGIERASVDAIGLTSLPGPVAFR